MSGSGTQTRLVRPRGGRTRWFSLARANRSLVLVKRIVADLVRWHRRLHECQETLEAAQAAGLGPLADDAREQLLLAGEGVRRCAGELRDVGAEVEDVRPGVIDFPARAGRREIRLCWRCGEPGVRYWHELGETFAERKSMDAFLA